MDNGECRIMLMHCDGNFRTQVGMVGVSKHTGEDII